MSKDNRNDIAYSEIRLLESHLKHRAIICYAMIVAGVISLVAGVVMLIIGITGDQVVWFQSGSAKITAGGFGAVTMISSVAWGYIAYRSRPEIEYKSPSFLVGLGSGRDLTREVRLTRRRQRNTSE